MEKTQEQKDCPHDQGWIWCECKICGWYDSVAGATRMKSFKNEFTIKKDNVLDKTFIDLK